MGASGSMNYVVASGSYVPGTILGNEHKQANSGFAANPRNVILLEKAGSTTTITQSLTVKYFQRVYDDGTAGYCYYTKTSIDPTPEASETSPNYTGTISDHSVVKILEIY